VALKSTSTLNIHIMLGIGWLETDVDGKHQELWGDTEWCCAKDRKFSYIKI